MPNARHVLNAACVFGVDSMKCCVVAVLQPEREWTIGALTAVVEPPGQLAPELRLRNWPNVEN